jgi:hypothetical protein
MSREQGQNNAPRWLVALGYLVADACIVVAAGGYLWTMVTTW